MAYEPHNWTCPFCGRDQVVTEAQADSFSRACHLAKTKYGLVGYTIHARVCANPNCRDVELITLFGHGEMISPTNRASYFRLKLEDSDVYRLRPRSFAKNQPDSVPAVLAHDYYEACAIRDLSPKASATLSRRVLQGMIRDFCNIKEDTLYKEIVAVEKLSAADNAPKGVAHETIEAMHHVRSIGNIGAHMEGDINTIVDVDPDEAQALIGLIELLFKDWYVARAARQAQLDQLKVMADGKKSAKQQPPAKAP